MPERTSYAHGTPSWTDLGTTDIAAAKAFYGGLFGWEAADNPTDQGMDYTMFSKNGKPVAGGGPLPPDMASKGMPPMWNSYVAVDSVDETVAKVEEAGGSLVMGPMDVMDAGRMAFVTDPTGAAIGLWQAGEHFGAQLVNEHGSLSWNELLTDDTATAQKFYADALGWGAETTDMPNGPYTTFKVGERPAAGMMEKNPNMGPIPNYWGVYFAVDDCDGCVEKVKELGGNVLMEAFDVPEVGRMAVLQDPQGATFSVIKLLNPTP